MGWAPSSSPDVSMIRSLEDRDALSAFLSRYPRAPSPGAGPDPDEVIAWLAEVGIRAEPEPGAQSVLWAIGHVDWPRQLHRVALYATPLTAVPDWVRQDARDRLYLDEIDPADVEGSVGPEAWPVVAWILAALRAPDAPERDALDRAGVSAPLGPGGLLQHACGATTPLGRVVQVIVLSLVIPCPGPTGQDLA